MKKNLLRTIVFLSLFSSNLYAQEADTLIYDSERPSNPLYDSLNTDIKGYLRVLQIADPQVTLALRPSFIPIADRSIPLSDAEGENGYILENNLEIRLPIYFGGIYSSNFFKKLRVTFDGGYTVRMTLDSSSPLVPNNNRFGFGIDYLLFKNNFTTVQLHHYSNGQSNNDFHISENPFRNNYRNGDFSTNYLKIMPVNYFREWEHFTGIFSLGYRREIKMGDKFNLSKELKNSYGLNRLLFDFNLAKNKTVKIKNNHDEKGYTISKTRDWGIRLNTEFILDSDLQDFPHSNKYRLGATGLVYYYPWQKGLLGFFAKSHYGRDYLNIRYDDVVFSIQGGLIFDLPKSIHRVYQ